MTLSKRKLILAGSLILVSLGIGLGQGCISNSGSSSVGAQNNGDYYSGKVGLIADSVSSYTKGINDDAKTLEVPPPPPITDPNACPNLAAMACTNGEKQAQYLGCSVGGSTTILYGAASLKYSSPICALDGVGQTVQSQYGLVFWTADNYKLGISSAVHTDYRGVALGGGDILGLVDSGLVLNSFGKRVMVKGPANDVLIDHSGRSVVPTVVHIDSVNETKTIVQGSTEFMDNLWKWTAKYTVEQLTFTKSCCHPISGSVAVEFSDGITGQGKVEFLSCGQARLEIEAKTYPLQLRACE